METPSSKDTGQPPENSIRWYEDLCFKNIKNSLTPNGAQIWSAQLDVAQDIEQSFQRSFFDNTFRNPHYSPPLSADQEVALKKYKDSKTPSEIAVEADRIANRLEGHIEDGTVDKEDIPTFDRKIEAAKAVSLDFNQESLRRKQATTPASLA